MASKTYTLPPLPYAYNALEPYISAQIMELHHRRHHQAYVVNLNKALQALAVASAAGDVAVQVALLGTIRFNGGGHINYSLFWRGLAPAGLPESEPTAAPHLAAALTQAWGGLDAFKEAFTAALLGIKGSGWGWLVCEPASGLRIITSKDQDSPASGVVPVLGIDMWEHAYYLQYLNSKAAYVDRKIVNWKTAEERYLRGPADAAAMVNEATA